MCVIFKRTFFICFKSAAWSFYWLPPSLAGIKIMNNHLLFNFCILFMVLKLSIIFILHHIFSKLQRSKLFISFSFGSCFVTLNQQNCNIILSSSIMFFSGWKKITIVHSIVDVYSTLVYTVAYLELLSSFLVIVHSWGLHPCFNFTAEEYRGM